MRESWIDGPRVQSLMAEMADREIPTGFSSDLARGLHRMAANIAKFCLTSMRSDGVPLDDSFVDMLCCTPTTSAPSFSSRRRPPPVTPGVSAGCLGAVQGP